MSADLDLDLELAIALISELASDAAISGTDRTAEARAPGRARVRIEFAPVIEPPATGDAQQRRRAGARLTGELRSFIESRLAVDGGTPLGYHDVSGTHGGRLWPGIP